MRDYFIDETRNHTYCSPGVIPTDIQIARWYWFKNNILNPIREHVGLPVHISSGIRDMAAYERLKKAGYYPSPKSDHFAGSVIELTEQKHIVQFGKYHHFSTFACDIDGKFDHKELCRDLFLTIREMIYPDDAQCVQGLSEFGCEQVILESQKKNGKKITWIHLSAPLEAYWSRNEAKVIRKMRNSIQFLEFKNGQYQVSKFE